MVVFNPDICFDRKKWIRFSEGGPPRWTGLVSNRLAVQYHRDPCGNAMYSRVQIKHNTFQQRQQISALRRCCMPVNARRTAHQLDMFLAVDKTSSSLPLPSRPPSRKGPNNRKGATRSPLLVHLIPAPNPEERPSQSFLQTTLPGPTQHASTASKSPSIASTIPQSQAPPFSA